jgi:hypothetical protein
MSLSESRLPCGGLNHRIKAVKKLTGSVQSPAPIHKRYRDSIVVKESKKPGRGSFSVVNASETGFAAR